MNILLIVGALIIFTCIFLNKVSSRLGIPVLLLFILLGVLLGWQDEVSIETTKRAGDICTVALIFIMFYGGFGTNWKAAKPVAVESGLLATVGVALTAGIVGVFCHFALGWGWIEGMIMGSVISSTDAATVFSILRTRKMGLKNNTAPMLELESGSNDPCSYMLTAVMLSVLAGTASGGQVVWMIFSQLVFGALGGILIAQGAAFVLRRFTLPKGFDMMFIVAVAVFGYAFPSLIGGNGYLSVYIIGIILGNSEFKGRKALVLFFDGVTTFVQILIFFILGYIAHPTNLPHVLLPAAIIFLFISLVARPIAVSSILAPFRKYPARQIGLVSFVGLRGAASIVFAIMTLTSGLPLENDIFDIVFCIVLISIALQGSLVPEAAKVFRMNDDNADVMRTFSDFNEHCELSFGKVKIPAGGAWDNTMVKDLVLPEDVKLLMVFRSGQKIITKGNTRLLAGDEVVFCAKSYDNATVADIREHPLSKNSSWTGKMIKDYPNNDGSHVVMIRRGDEQIIPDGNTVLCAGDILYLLNSESVDS